MPIERIHSFLVHPAKHDEAQPEIGGTEVHRRGSLYEMLARVFERASEECHIEIVFRPDEAGQQQNECRDLLVTYIQHPTTANGRNIASRLQAVTTHRSGLGLLFLIKGISDEDHQLVISRFPADQGIIAHEDARQLSVEFLERVFMKSAKAYKSAIYTSDSVERGFWEGRAIDLQISGTRELSDYWIRDFLDSQLRTTGPAGTKRFALALREAIRAAETLGIRHELISVASLVRGQRGQRRSTRQILGQLQISNEATAAIEAEFQRPELIDEVFQFDSDEFQRHAPYRAVELDNGGLLIAEDSRFDQVFQHEAVNVAEERIRFVTEGRVVDEYLRKNK